MDITCIAFGVLFIVAGALFANGQIHSRVAAWKSMPESEKNKIKIVPLCHNIGAVIALCGLVFIARGVFGLSGRVFVGAFAVWMAVAFIDVFWYIEKKGAYRIKDTKHKKLPNKRR